MCWRERGQKERERERYIYIYAHIYIYMIIYIYIHTRSHGDRWPLYLLLSYIILYSIAGWLQHMNSYTVTPVIQPTCLGSQRVCAKSIHPCQHAQKNQTLPPCFDHFVVRMTPFPHPRPTCTKMRQHKVPQISTERRGGDDAWSVFRLAFVRDYL